MSDRELSATDGQLTVPGAGYLAQRLMRSDRAMAAIADLPRSLVVNLKNLCLVDCADDEQSAPAPTREWGNRQAIAESCLWAG